MMCDPLLDIAVVDGHLDTAVERKGAAMDEIETAFLPDEFSPPDETEFDPESEIPGEPMDEYQAIITAKDAWLACEDLADICRERDKEICVLRDRLVRMGIVAGNIRTLVDKIEMVAVEAV